jgi:hypothetical protein
MVAHSQVGYTPDQSKIAIIELDRNDRPARNAQLLRVNEDGGTSVALRAQTQPWAGTYLR